MRRFWIAPLNCDNAIGSTDGLEEVLISEELLHRSFTTALKEVVSFLKLRLFPLSFHDLASSLQVIAHFI